MYNIEIHVPTKAFILSRLLIHILNDADRGPTLEAVVSRMKTIRATSDASLESLRILAVSATIPNAEDIATWLSDESTSAKHFKYCPFIILLFFVN